MGRIKSSMIKRATRQLLVANESFNTSFNTSFETNKKILGNTMPSKSTRNKIAGYIARLKRMETKVKKPKKEEGIASDEIPQYEQH